MLELIVTFANDPDETLGLQVLGFSCRIFILPFSLMIYCFKLEDYGFIFLLILTRKYGDYSYNSTERIYKPISSEDMQK